ncbi:saccharopine dehydrogenase C-terminal domain-containing protein [Paraflavitalea sp. CAU 1676]|uniref:saccharopine dehydrogenase C-terminal domain-containing protein n=1 Tax=Paraflavitalea sp. CAU 1676 TaxID=3032598 RepID=UPI0023DA6C3C|nr:saccharopine dehydrogenase C-terminal domain-containing protein [Paraflavitalea sp. CAU 1676]MDF2187872.1 saccharopine dehydrogenase C-terminal domain-containing protein [Paraflavitalea sp. CAU 1676]
MKHILVLGAGKSATCLIDHLIRTVQAHQWELTVADSNLALARAKTTNAPRTEAIALAVEDPDARRYWIAKSDMVISLLPPALHILVAQDCVHLGRNLLTASYVDENMAALGPAIREKGLLFLCEMGLDPGIDHMSAMQLIDRIRQSGGRITSFKSHCGGLEDPGSDNNPWRYKISWNPRNVIMAGKSGAVFKEDGQVIDMPYASLFNPNRVVQVPGLEQLAWYPNRDSLSYMPIYGLEDTPTFIRTTLRYPEFCFGWKNLIDLKLTDETSFYETDGMTLQQFFREHFETHGFSEWIERQLTARVAQTKQLLEKLQALLHAEQEVSEADRKALQEFMMINDDGQLLDVNLNQIKTQAAAAVAGQMHEANLSMKQLIYLGMDDNRTLINKGRCSAADVLQFAAEMKLALGRNDKDMVVMMHEIGFETEAGLSNHITSTLVLSGEDTLRTAMAKTVGLPLAIAAELILLDKIQLRGLHIPILPELYDPVLEALRKQGIVFIEHISR